MHLTGRKSFVPSVGGYKSQPICPHNDQDQPGLPCLTITNFVGAWGENESAWKWQFAAKSNCEIVSSCLCMHVIAMQRLTASWSGSDFATLKTSHESAAKEAALVAKGLEDALARAQSEVCPK